MMLLTVHALYSSPDWDERFSFEFNPSVFKRAFDSQPEQVSDVYSNRGRVVGAVYEHIYIHIHSSTCV